MLKESRRKQYVEVIATHHVDGQVRPQLIRIPLLGDYEITEVKRVGTTKDFTTNEIAKRYTIMVKGKETSLYEDSGRWFVLLKT